MAILRLTLFSTLLSTLLSTWIMPEKAQSQDLVGMAGVFKKEGFDRSCVKLPAKTLNGGAGAAPDYAWANPALNKILQDLKIGIQTENVELLKPLFHPQLKVTTAAINEVLNKQKTVIGKKYSTSIEQVWAVYSKERTVDRIKCEDDVMQISPLYGYDHQISTWIQSTGTLEAGRFFVTLVPKEKTWYIGNFHWHQWTQKTKDYRNWTEEADGLFKSKNFIAAWVYYDLARKLLNGKTYFVHAGETLISEHQKNFAPGNSWEAEVLKIFPAEKVVHLASVLTTDGVGLMMRFAIDKELSAVAIKEHCKKSLRSLIAQPWFGPLSGLRCGYVLPREPQDKDGHLGSIYFDRTTLDK